MAFHKQLESLTARCRPAVKTASSPALNGYASRSTCSATRLFRTRHLLWCRRGYIAASGADSFTQDASSGYQFVSLDMAAERCRELLDVIPDLQLRTETFRYEQHRGTWEWATAPAAR